MKANRAQASAANRSTPRERALNGGAAPSGRSAPTQRRNIDPTRAHRRLGLGMFGTVAYIGVGLAITMMLVALKLCIEHTSVGASMEKRTYEVLTSALPSFRPNGTNVTLLDVGHLRVGVEDPASGRLVPTPRAELMKIIEALVTLRPRAIGVDIDFSPTPNGWVDDDDFRFFQKCLELNETTPIVLGVFRTMREPRDAWLGLPAYSTMAGSMWLPDSELERTPVWTQAPGVRDRLPSFGAALAKAASSRQDSGEVESGWRKRFRERVTRSVDGLTVEEVLTDYSASKQISRESIRITSVDQLQRYRGHIEGRVVILGAVDRAPDRFPVPGQLREIPGVVVHAAVVNTLASEPIWELSDGVRIALDILLSLTLLIAALILGHRSRRGAHAAIEASEKRVLRWLVLLTFVSGIAAVVLLRVLWLDFFLVALSLVLHPMIGRRLQHTSFGRALWRHKSLTAT